MAIRKDTSTFREMSKLTKFAFVLSALSPLFLYWAGILCYQNKEFLVWGGISWKCIVLFSDKFLFPILFFLFSIVGNYLLKISICLFRRSKECNSEYITIDNINNNNKELIGFVLGLILPFLAKDFIEILGIIIVICLIYKIFIDSEYIIYNPILKLFYRYSIYKCSVKGVDSNVICTDDIELEEGKVYGLYNIGRNVYFI